MTRYEQGFMNKCAEYGIDGKALLKAAQTAEAPDAAAAQALADSLDQTLPRDLPGAGKWGARIGGYGSIPYLGSAGVGAALGAMIDRKKRLRGALIGALLGIPVGGTALGYAAGKQVQRGYTGFRQGLIDAARKGGAA